MLICAKWILIHKVYLRCEQVINLLETAIGMYELESVKELMGIFSENVLLRNSVGFVNRLVTMDLNLLNEFLRNDLRIKAVC